MKNLNILVTGGAGYIGSHVVEVLVKKKYNVIIFDNLITGHKKLINKKAQFIRGDIKSYNKISKVIKDFKINSIIHLAALIGIPYSYYSPLAYIKTNVEGTYNILESSKNYSKKKVIITGKYLQKMAEKKLEKMLMNGQNKPTSWALEKFY